MISETTPVWSSHLGGEKRMKKDISVLHDLLSVNYPDKDVGQYQSNMNV